MLRRLIRHPLSPVTKRAGVALFAVFVVMTVGTVGTKVLTGWGWIYSFYFMSMTATAEGPPSAPPNAASQVFISVMAFVSIGTLITAVGTIFGPFLGYVFHKGVRFAEREIEWESEKARGKRKSPEDPST